MALRNQRAVLANLDRMAGKRIRRMAARYREETLAPLVRALHSADSADAALEMLDSAMLRRMAIDPLADAIEAHEVQTACIGRATAIRHEATKRRSHGAMK